MRKNIAELIGTFALVFIGCSAAVLTNDLGWMGIAFAFGFTVTAMAYAVGPISGCHLNPAVTIAMLVAGKIKPVDAGGYIVSQCIGATLGSLMLYLILSGQNAGFTLEDGGLAANGWDDFNTTTAFITEVVATFLFLFIIFAATHKRGNGGMAGLVIGIGLAVLIMASVKVTGASLNPARSLAPAIVGALRGNTKALSQVWLFVTAPVLGAVLSALTWKGLFDKETAV